MALLQRVQGDGIGATCATRVCVATSKAEGQEKKRKKTRTLRGAGGGRPRIQSQQSETMWDSRYASGGTDREKGALWRGAGGWAGPGGINQDCTAPGFGRASMEGLPTIKGKLRSGASGGNAQESLKKIGGEGGWSTPGRLRALDIVNIRFSQSPVDEKGHGERRGSTSARSSAYK